MPLEQLAFKSFALSCRLLAIRAPCALRRERDREMQTPLLELLSKAGASSKARFPKSDVQFQKVAISRARSKNDSTDLAPRSSRSAVRGAICRSERRTSSEMARVTAETSSACSGVAAAVDSERSAATRHEGCVTAGFGVPSVVSGVWSGSLSRSMKTSGSRSERIAARSVNKASSQQLGAGRDVVSFAASVKRVGSGMGAAPSSSALTKACSFDPLSW
eukprot:6183951-Pleurochrysis_carterae.AAC.1